MFSSVSIDMPMANDLWIMKLSKITLEKNNRMLRIGFGRHNSEWFARVDLWFLGIRITK